jgi:hypothetical protein
MLIEVWPGVHSLEKADGVFRENVRHRLRVNA